MRFHVLFSLSLLLLTFISGPVFADDLGSAFEKARKIIRKWKPSPSSESNRSRDEREERASKPQRQTPRQKQPDQRAIERARKKQQREKERQRIQENLKILNTNLASARNTPRVTQLTTSELDLVSISAREQQLDALMRSENVLEALRLSSAAKEEARQNAKIVQDALARGDKPPFKPLWDYYKYNRPIALGLVPNDAKCAIVMSMTLGVEPRPNELSLHDIGNKKLVDQLVSPIKTMLLLPVKDSEIAKRYYVRAQELADRLKSDWGAPIELKGKNARGAIANKKGIIFLKNAYGVRGSGDHIDLWDRDHVASTASTPYWRAEKVWFWEIR